MPAFQYDDATEAKQPQTGTGSPDGVVTSRYAGDEYIDTDTDEIYKASVKASSSDWQLITI